MPPGHWRTYFYPDERPGDVYEVDEHDPQTPAWAAQTCAKLRKRLRSDETINCYQGYPRRTQQLWALVESPPRYDGDSIHWRVSHTDGSGKTVWTTPIPAGNGEDPNVAGNDYATVPTVLSIFDINSDGSEELITGATKWLDSGNHTVNSVMIWRSRPREVRRVSPGYHASYADNSDGDGRLDLIVDPYRVIIGSDSEGWVAASALWSLFVELDLQGRVIENGRASKRYAGRLCPTSEGLIEGLSTTDPWCIAGYVHCAKLWGLSPPDIEAALDARCEADGALGLCEHSLPSWRSMTRVNLPFRLTTDDHDALCGLEYPPWARWGVMIEPLPAWCSRAPRAGVPVPP